MFKKWKLTKFVSSQTNKKKRYKRSERKVCFKHYELCIGATNRNLKIKNIINFDENNCNSIKSFAVKKEERNVNAAGRLMNEKMLMFARVSLNSFI